MVWGWLVEWAWKAGDFCPQAPPIQSHHHGNRKGDRGNWKPGLDGRGWEKGRDCGRREPPPWRRVQGHGK